MHTDGQLRASHLILGCNPLYFTWQSFSQALLVDSPLLSYIDVRHSNLLPPPLFLTVGEASDLGPRIVRAKSLVPLKDTSAETVSRNRFVHRLIERLEDPALVRVTELAEAEFVNSLRAESDPGEDEMVTRWVMTIGHFVLSACPTAQQQEPHGRNPTPSSPPPPSRSRKR